MAPDAPDVPDTREIEFYEDLAWRLKLAVEALDLPKGEIATAIGVSQQRLSNWITNQNKPDWFFVTRFCRRFGVSADWLLLGEVSGLKHSMAASLALAVEERKARSKVEVSQEADTSKRQTL